MLLQHVWDLHFDPSTNILDVYVGACGARWIPSRPIRSFNRARRRFCSVLSLRRCDPRPQAGADLHRHIGAAVVALLGYVYWSTASYVQGRSDRAIAAEHACCARPMTRPARRTDRRDRAAHRRAHAPGRRTAMSTARRCRPGAARRQPCAVAGGAVRRGGWANFHAPLATGSAGGRPLLRASSKRCRTAITCWSAGY